MNRRMPPGGGPNRPQGSLREGLARVDALIGAGQVGPAMALLSELDGRFRDEPAVLSRLLGLAVAADDVLAILALAERLARLRPNEPEVALNLAIARLRLSHLALAHRAFAAFAKRWPGHPKAAQARIQADELLPAIAERWAGQGLAGPPDLDLMARNEEVQSLLSAGHWQQAITLGEQALRARPDFVSLSNNLSLAYQNLGRLDKAIATARQVLARDPQNLHALGNLTRFLVLAGQLDEAAEWAERLKAFPNHSVDIAVKQAEALSFLGDDEGVLAAFERVQKLKGRDDDPTASALLHHLAAVAAFRQGRSQAAHRRWQKARELSPGLELVAANLADLERPADEQHAPWPYSIEYWLQRATIEELMRELRGRPGRSDEALSRDAQRFLRRRPEVAAIIPLLLDRGDPPAREFALRLAGLAQTPALLAALAAFAQGQRGPVELRLKAAQLAQRGGALANGMVRFWRDGVWHDTLMFGMELHGEPLPTTLPPHVVAIQREAATALRAGDAARSEQLLQQALALAPDDPSLLNNLGAAYGKLGRYAEAEAMARRLAAEHPDYLFARTNLVSYLIKEGKIAEAQALIDPLLRRSQMHFGEFGALAGAQVQIFIAQGNLGNAKSWLELWEQVDPEHAHLELYRNMLHAVKPRKRQRR